MRGSNLPKFLLVFLILFGCMENAKRDFDVKEEYTFEFSERTSSENIKDLFENYGAKVGASITDRSESAESELRLLEHGRFILESTDGKLILLTVEKPKKWRISLTNAGLGNKLQLSLNYPSERSPSDIHGILSRIVKDDPGIKIIKLRR